MIMADATTQMLTMDELLAEQEVKQLYSGDTVEGKILKIKKNEVLVDLGLFGLGVLSRRELGSSALEEGAEVSASVVDNDMEDGSIMLSMRRVSKEKGWDDLQKTFEAGEIIEVSPYDANRGGLLIELGGVRGFMPVSQLSADNYPRVTGADKDEILQKLGSLVGQTLKVRILDVNRKDNKLIFSEKEAAKEGMKARFESLKVGDSVKGMITGVVDFGAFVNVDGIEGLVHISEISWDRVENPKDYVKVGDAIEAKIIGIDKERLSLSLKQLADDPWVKQVEEMGAGTVVKGRITRITPFGAFVQISKSVEALVHISEMGVTGEKGEKSDPEKVFTLGEEKEFVVLEVNKDNRKISLSLKK
jgi:small subunit ribosomal protein S1